MKILIIDEWSLLKEMEQSFFKRSGIQITLAEDGAAMIQKALTEKPDLIILDTQASQIDGLLCCQKIKAHPEGGNVPILLIASEGEIDHFLHAGFHDLVQRPVTQKGLMENITKYLHVKKRISERIPFTRKVKCCRENDLPFEFTSKNISRNGMFLKSKRPLSKGDRLQLSFRMSKKISSGMNIDGKVVRIVKDEKDSHLIAGMGIHFQKMLDKEKGMIAAYIDKKLHARTSNDRPSL